MLRKINVLLAEDESALGLLLKEGLEVKGFWVDHHTNGITALTAFKQRKPDILVIDIMMPQKDGLTLTKEIRTLDKSVPIILLTSRSLGSDVVGGFQAGCNDYVRKPFSMEELIVRMEALVARSELPAAAATLIPIGAYLFSPAKQTLQYGTDIQALTHRESSLLELLATHPQSVLGRIEILQKIWGNDDFFAGRSLDVFITKLRKKLSQDQQVVILNVRGIGYKIVF